MDFRCPLAPGPYPSAKAIPFKRCGIWPSRCASTGRPQISVASFYGSVFPAVQNLLLACRAVGPAASLQTLTNWWVPAVRRILGLPRNIVPVCIIPIGWAKGHYGSTARRSMGDVVHLDRYGNQPFG